MHDLLLPHKTLNIYQETPKGSLHFLQKNNATPDKSWIFGFVWYFHFSTLFEICQHFSKNMQSRQQKLPA